LGDEVPEFDEPSLETVAPLVMEHVDGDVSVESLPCDPPPFFTP
jgi:hypothetical protein